MRNLSVLARVGRDGIVLREDCKSEGRVGRLCKDKHFQEIHPLAAAWLSLKLLFLKLD